MSESTESKVYADLAEAVLVMLLPQQPVSWEKEEAKGNGRTRRKSEVALIPRRDSSLKSAKKRTRKNGEEFNLNDDNFDPIKKIEELIEQNKILMIQNDLLSRKVESLANTVQILTSKVTKSFEKKQRRST